MVKKTQHRIAAVVNCALKEIGIALAWIEQLSSDGKNDIVKSRGQKKEKAINSIV